MQTNTTNSRKQLVVLFALAALLGVTTLSARPLIFGSTEPYTLKKADPLYGRIAQELTPVDGSSAPIPKKDFTLKNTTYFEDGSWVVSSISFTQVGRGDGGMVVMQKTDGVFDVVLGPSTSFDTLSVDKLPNSVALYVKNNGVVYEPVL